MDRYADSLCIEEDHRIKVHSPLADKSGSALMPWGIRAIRAPQAWSRSTGVHVKIGVIDTGVDFRHPDLRHSLASGVNLLNRGMMPLDDNGHGTHIAGTLAAAGGARNMMGVAPGRCSIRSRPSTTTAPLMCRILSLASIGAYRTKSISLT